MGYFVFSHDVFVLYLRASKPRPYGIVGGKFIRKPILSLARACALPTILKTGFIVSELPKTRQKRYDYQSKKSLKHA
jgi:hypothetical protein